MALHPGRQGRESHPGFVVPEIDTTKCTGCGDCVEGCPAGAAGLVKGKAGIVRPDDCDYCTDCEALCPEGAISCPFEIVLSDIGQGGQGPGASHQSGTGATQNEAG